MSGWGPALRMSRRDIRANLGRSALIAGLIMLPVVALSFAAVTYDMFQLTAGETFQRRAGAADAELVWRYTTAVQQDWTGLEVLPISDSASVPESVTSADLLAILPAGSRVIAHDVAQVTLTTATGVGSLEIHALDATDRLAEGMVRVLSGAAPTAAGEMAVSAEAATRLGVAVGDTVSTVGTASTVSTASGDGSWLVTGTVEFPLDLGEQVLVNAGCLPELATDVRQATRWLVDTPETVTWANVEDLNDRGLSVISKAVYASPPSASITDYPNDSDETSDSDAGVASAGALMVSLGLLEVVLLAGPAFAVGARRRRRDLALVAANGASAAQLRRVVLADGVVLGAVGAVVGIACGIVAAFLARPAIEEHLMSERAGGYRVFPLALVGIAVLAVGTGVLAALLPAITAARARLSDALAGRAGTRRHRRWPGLAGLVVVAIGGYIAWYGASHVSRQHLVAGVVLAIIGVLLGIPTLVGAIAAVGPLLPVAPRMALRDTARNRSSAAPAVAAIMAAVAGSVAAGTYLISYQEQQTARYQQGMPVGTTYIRYSDKSVAADDWRHPTNEVSQAVRSSYPVADLIEVTSVGCSQSPQNGQSCGLSPLPATSQRCFMEDLTRPYTLSQQAAALGDSRCHDLGRWQTGNGVGIVAGDVDLLAAVAQPDDGDLAKARAVLEAGGVVVADASYLADDGTVTLAIEDSREPSGQNVALEDLPHVTVPGYLLTTGYAPGLVFCSSQVVSQSGFALQGVGILVDSGAIPTQADEDSLRSALLVADPEAHMTIERGAQTGRDSRLYLIALVEALITLGAAAIATGLAAIDGRADLTILAAVGASPRIRRWLVLSQAGLISGIGSILGVTVGVSATFAAMTAYNQEAARHWPIIPAFPLTVSWEALVVASVAPLVAMVASAVFTRSRLPVELIE